MTRPIIFDLQLSIVLGWLRASWAVTTRKLIERLDDSPTFRREITSVVNLLREPENREAALLSLLSPLHPEADPLGLKCLLQEGSLSLIDWPAVLASLDRP